MSSFGNELDRYLRRLDERHRLYALQYAEQLSMGEPAPSAVGLDRAIVREVRRRIWAECTGLEVGLVTDELYRRDHHFVSCFVTVTATADPTNRSAGRVRVSAGATMELPDALELAESIIAAAREVALGVVPMEET